MPENSNPYKKLESIRQKKMEAFVDTLVAMDPAYKGATKDFVYSDISTLLNKPEEERLRIYSLMAKEKPAIYGATSEEVRTNLRRLFNPVAPDIEKKAEDFELFKPDYTSWEQVLSESLPEGTSDTVGGGDLQAKLDEWKKEYTSKSDKGFKDQLRWAKKFIQMEPDAYGGATPDFVLRDLKQFLTSQSPEKRRAILQASKVYAGWDPIDAEKDIAQHLQIDIPGFIAERQEYSSDFKGNISSTNLWQASKKKELYMPSEQAPSIPLEDYSDIVQAQVGLAQSYLGLREEGTSNSGSEIAKFQEFTGAKGQPWCASAVSCIVHETAEAKGVTTDFPKTASSQEIRRWAEKRGALRSTPKVGDVVVWRNEGSNTGHVGIVTAVNPDGTIQTIEGNTSEQGSNGVGVAMGTKTHNVQQEMNATGRKLVGFVDVNRIYGRQGTESDLKFISSNEGTYTSVNKDDNGAVSLGQLQWHGENARGLLKKLRAADPYQFDSIMGGIKDELDSDWSNRVFNAEEEKAFKKLMTLDTMKDVQDELGNQKLQADRDYAKTKGITEEPAIRYFMDLVNQYGRGGAEQFLTNGPTLEAMHSIAISKDEYTERRKRVYKAVKPSSVDDGRVRRELGTQVAMSQQEKKQNAEKAFKVVGALEGQRTLEEQQKAEAQLQYEMTHPKPLDISEDEMFKDYTEFTQKKEAKFPLVTSYDRQELPEETRYLLYRENLEKKVRAITAPTLENLERVQQGLSKQDEIDKLTYQLEAFDKAYAQTADIKGTEEWEDTFDSMFRFNAAVNQTRGELEKHKTLLATQAMENPQLPGSPDFQRKIEAIDKTLSYSDNVLGQALAMSGPTKDVMERVDSLRKEIEEIDKQISANYKEVDGQLVFNPEVTEWFTTEEKWLLEEKTNIDKLANQSWTTQEEVDSANARIAAYNERLNYYVEKSEEFATIQENSKTLFSNYKNILKELKKYQDYKTKYPVSVVTNLNTLVEFNDLHENAEKIKEEMRKQNDLNQEKAAQKEKELTLKLNEMGSDPVEFFEDQNLIAGLATRLGRDLALELFGDEKTKQAFADRYALQMAIKILKDTRNLAREKETWQEAAQASLATNLTPELAPFIGQIVGLENTFRKNNLVDKYLEGKELSKAEQEFIDALELQISTQQGISESEKPDMMVRQGVAGILGLFTYIPEFIATGGVATAGKAAVIKGTTSLVEKYAKFIPSALRSQKAINAWGTFAEIVPLSVTQSVIARPIGTYTDFLERRMPLTLEDGELTLVEKSPMILDAAKAISLNAAEFMTERVGAFFTPALKRMVLPNYLKVGKEELRKLGADVAQAPLYREVIETNLRQGRLTKMANYLKKHAAFNGVAEEQIEEYVNLMASNLIEGNDLFEGFDMDFVGGTFIALAPLSLLGVGGALQNRKAQKFMEAQNAAYRVLRKNFDEDAETWYLGQAKLLNPDATLEDLTNRNGKVFLKGKEEIELPDVPTKEVNVHDMIPLLEGEMVIPDVDKIREALVGTLQEKYVEELQNREVSYSKTINEKLDKLYIRVFGKDEASPKEKFEKLQEYFKHAQKESELEVIEEERKSKEFTPMQQDELDRLIEEQAELLTQTKFENYYDLISAVHLGFYTRLEDGKEKKVFPIVGEKEAQISRRIEELENREYELRNKYRRENEKWGFKDGKLGAIRQTGFEDLAEEVEPTKVFRASESPRNKTVVTKPSQPEIIPVQANIEPTQVGDYVFVPVRSAIDINKELTKEEYEQYLPGLQTSPYSFENLSKKEPVTGRTLYKVKAELDVNGYKAEASGRSLVELNADGSNLDQVNDVLNFRGYNALEKKDIVTGLREIEQRIREIKNVTNWKGENLDEIFQDIYGRFGIGENGQMNIGNFKITVDPLANNVSGRKGGAGRTVGHEIGHRLFEKYFPEMVVSMQEAIKKDSKFLPKVLGSKLAREVDATTKRVVESNPTIKYHELAAQELLAELFADVIDERAGIAKTGSDLSSKLTPYIGEKLAKRFRNGFVLFGNIGKLFSKLTNSRKITLRAIANDAIERFAAGEGFNPEWREKLGLSPLEVKPTPEVTESELFGEKNDTQTREPVRSPVEGREEAVRPSEPQEGTGEREADQLLQTPQEVTQVSPKTFEKAKKGDKLRLIDGTIREVKKVSKPNAGFTAAIDTWNSPEGALNTVQARHVSEVIFQVAEKKTKATEKKVASEAKKAEKILAKLPSHQLRQLNLNNLEKQLTPSEVDSIQEQVFINSPEDIASRYTADTPLSRYARLFAAQREFYDSVPEITEVMSTQLTSLGYTPEDINNMSPSQAMEIITTATPKNPVLLSAREFGTEYETLLSEIGNVEEIRDENGRLLAPNGQVTNLTEHQWKLVRTPTFKIWFGDWENTPESASKVVDENGEPRVVYHKTDSDFSVFSEDKIGKNDEGYAGKGFYFSKQPLEGYTYGRINIPAFLVVKTPFIRTAENWNQDDFVPYNWIPARREEIVREDGSDIVSIEIERQAATEWRDTAIQRGYDGFIDNAMGEGKGELTVFYPNQIKSAIGSLYTEDADILKSARSEANSTEAFTKRKKYISQISAEAVLGSLGDIILPGLYTASYEDKVKYTEDILNALIDYNVFIPAKELGLETMNEVVPGWWEGTSNPVISIEVPKFTRTNLNEFLPKIEALSSVLGYLLKQDAVGYNIPVSPTMDRPYLQNGYFISGEFNSETLSKLDAALGTGYALVSDSKGLRILDFENRGRENITLAFNEINGDFEITPFTFVGGLVENDWKENPNGEAYLERTRRGGSPRLYRRMLSDLRQAIAYVNERYAYEWGDSGFFEREGDEAYRFGQESLKPIAAAFQIGDVVGIGNNHAEAYQALVQAGIRGLGNLKQQEDGRFITAVGEVITRNESTSGRRAEIAQRNSPFDIAKAAEVLNSWGVKVVTNEGVSDAEVYTLAPSMNINGVNYVGAAHVFIQDAHGEGVSEFMTNKGPVPYAVGLKLPAKPNLEEAQRVADEINSLEDYNSLKSARELSPREKVRIEEYVTNNPTEQGILDKYLPGSPKFNYAMQYLKDMDILDSEEFYKKYNVTLASARWQPLILNGDQTRELVKKDDPESRKQFVLAINGDPSLLDHLGWSKEDFHNKLAEWGIDAPGMKLSLAINDPEKSVLPPWTGIANLAVAKNFTEKDTESLFAKYWSTFSAVKSNEVINAINTFLLAFDGSLKYQDLKVSLGSDIIDSRSVAHYDVFRNQVNIGVPESATVYHEFGHYIDYLLGEDLVGFPIAVSEILSEKLEIPVTEDEIREAESNYAELRVTSGKGPAVTGYANATKILATAAYHKLNIGQLEWLNRLEEFVDTLDFNPDVAVTSEMFDYFNSNTEKIARFSEAFVNWVRKQAGEIVGEESYTQSREIEHVAKYMGEVLTKSDVIDAMRYSANSVGVVLTPEVFEKQIGYVDFVDGNPRPVGLFEVKPPTYGRYSVHDYATKVSYRFTLEELKNYAPDIKDQHNAVGPHLFASEIAYDVPLLKFTEQNFLDFIQLLREKEALDNHNTLFSQREFSEEEVNTLRFALGEENKNGNFKTSQRIRVEALLRLSTWTEKNVITAYDLLAKYFNDPNFLEKQTEKSTTATLLGIDDGRHLVNPDQEKLGRSKEYAKFRIDTPRLDSFAVPRIERSFWAAEKLRPHQRDGFNLGVEALEEGNYFIDGSGTGSGKTFTQLAIAQYQVEKTGLPTIIFTDNRTILETSFKPTAEAMGIELIPIEAKEEMTAGKIYITPISRISSFEDARSGLVIFDESQKLINENTEVSRIARRVMGKSAKTMLSSASLADKKDHYWYISEVVGEDLEKRLDLKKNPEDMTTEEIRERERSIRKYFDNLKFTGKMIEYNVTLEGTTPIIAQAQLSKKQREEYNRLVDKVGERAIYTTRLQEQIKFPQIVAAVQQEVKAKRKVIVYADSVKEIEGWSTVNELKKKFPKFEVLTGDTTDKKKAQIVRDFQAGKIQGIITTPQSGDTGISLDDQVGNAPRSIVMASVPWSFINYLQIAGRINRSNTKSPSRIVMVASNTDYDFWRYSILLAKLSEMTATSKATRSFAETFYVPRYADPIKLIEEYKGEVELFKSIEGKIFDNYFEYGKGRVRFKHDYSKDIIIVEEFEGDKKIAEQFLADMVGQEVIINNPLMKSFDINLDDLIYKSNAVYSKRSLLIDLNQVKLKKNSLGELVAPNGQPSHLNELQWKIVRTPTFKKWFGDWEVNPENASKVLDENGEPMVVFHGTSGLFESFAFTVKPENTYWVNFGKYFIAKGGPKARIVEETDRVVLTIDAKGTSYHNTVDAAKKEYENSKEEIYITRRPAFYFAQNPLYAANFARDNNGSVIPGYLNIRNPFDYRSEAAVKIVEDYVRGNFNNLLPYFNTNKVFREVTPTPTAIVNYFKKGSWAVLETFTPLTDYIKSLGYDGYLSIEGGYDFENGDRGGLETSVNWAFFNTNQVKSAIFSEFGKSPNMLKSARDIPGEIKQYFMDGGDKDHLLKTLFPEYETADTAHKNQIRWDVLSSIQALGYNNLGEYMQSLSEGTTPYSGQAGFIDKNIEQEYYVADADLLRPKGEGKILKYNFYLRFYDQYYDLKLLQNNVLRNTQSMSMYGKKYNELDKKKKKEIDDLIRAGFVLPDSLDAYNGETRWKGVTANIQRYILQKEQQPFLDMLKEAQDKHKIEMRDVHNFMWARHAPERNWYIAQVNEEFRGNPLGKTMYSKYLDQIIDMYDVLEDKPGSGLRNEDALEILRGFYADVELREDQFGQKIDLILGNPIGERGRAMQELADFLSDILEKNRQVQVANEENPINIDDYLITAQLESTEQIESFRQHYKYYVPLNGYDVDYYISNAEAENGVAKDVLEEEQFMEMLFKSYYDEGGRTPGITRGGGGPRAAGRITLPGNVINNIFKKRFNTLVRVTNLQEVGLPLLNLINSLTDIDVKRQQQALLDKYYAGDLSITEYDREFEKLRNTHMWLAPGEVPLVRQLNSKTGMFEARPDISSSTDLSTTVLFRHQGKTIRVSFSKKNTAGIQLAKSLNALGVVKAPRFFRIVTGYYGLLRNLFTSWNVDFTIPNMQRDVGTAFIHRLGESTGGFWRNLGQSFSMLGKVMRAMPGIMKVIGQEREGRVFKKPNWYKNWLNNDTQFMKDFKEYRTYGGLTGVLKDITLTDLTKELNQRSGLHEGMLSKWMIRRGLNTGTEAGVKKWFNRIKRREAISNAAKTVVGKVPLMNAFTGFGGAMIDALEHISIAGENATRVAYYTEMKKHYQQVFRKRYPNYSKEKINEMAAKKAVSLAKDVTVRFDRTGTWGANLKAMYLFINPALQGQYRILDALETRGGGRYKKLLGALGGILFFYNMFIRYLLGTDDDGSYFYDKIPSDFRQNNILIPIPGNPGILKDVWPFRYVEFGQSNWGAFAWRVPFIYKILNTGAITLLDIINNPSGRSQSDVLLHGAVNLAAEVTGSFNPWGDENLGFRTVFPTFARPIVDTWLNEGWWGGDIHPERFPTDRTPKSQIYTSRTREDTKWLADALNDWTGGYKYESGWLDLYPDDIQYHMDQFLGGLGKSIMNMANFVHSSMGGEKTPLHRIPIFRTMFMLERPAFSSAQYFEILDAIVDEKDQYNKISKTPKSEADPEMLERWDNLRESKRSGILSLDEFAKARKKVINELYGKWKVAEGEEKTKLMDRIVDLQQDLIRKYNERR